MKVIGTVGYKKYLCEVDHTEIEKFMGLYYDKLKELKVGDVVDLGKGHDHASEIKSAMDKTREFVKSHQRVVNCIVDGLRVERLMEAASDGKAGDA